MNVDAVGAFVHQHAPHSGTALFLASCIAAAVALIGVYGHCLVARSSRHLAENWIVSVSTSAAPIPTYVLLILVPLDPDLRATLLDDPVVVALVGLYGLGAAYREVRAATLRARDAKKAAALAEAQTAPSG